MSEQVFLDQPERPSLEEQRRIRAIELSTSLTINVNGTVEDAINGARSIEEFLTATGSPQTD